MATLSSATLKPPLHSTPSSKPTSLSSSSSVFFTSHYKISSRPGLSLTRPVKSQNRGFTCTCLFGLGVPELVVIAGVAALVFGPKQLPEVGRSIGKTVKSFQMAAKEFESELKKDGESSEKPASEEITPVNEEGKQEVNVPTTKESS